MKSACSPKHIDIEIRPSEGRRHGSCWEDKRMTRLTSYMNTGESSAQLKGSIEGACVM